ncbi:CHD3-type chromatin-remodeling factor CHR7 [Paramyrothecium foliicola]|nr:CHD3-type chromatin-remodeling factor CHR7 [Paramyrothecium foliicola]
MPNKDNDGGGTRLQWTKPPALLLHSPTYEILKKRISVMIFDESHHAKNWGSKLNSGIRSPRYHYAFVLTGTPIFNKWEDWPAQPALLPGDPFTNLEHSRSFAGNESLARSSRVLSQNEESAESLADLDECNEVIVMEDITERRKVLLRGQRTVYKSEGFIYAQDDEDLNYNDKVGLEQIDDDLPPRRPRRADPKYAAKWLKALEQATDEDVLSPRIFSVLEKVIQARREFEGEKILIMSSFVMILDTDKEALTRRRETDSHLESIGISEFNGTIRDDGDRAARLNKFNKEVGGPDIMLLSSGAGGTGLNLARASDTIMGEPRWNHGNRGTLLLISAFYTLILATAKRSTILGLKLRQVETSVLQSRVAGLWRGWERWH